MDSRNKIGSQRKNCKISYYVIILDNRQEVFDGIPV
jgi:hypothetical protein